MASKNVNKPTPPYANASPSPTLQQHQQQRPTSSPISKRRDPRTLHSYEEPLYIVDPYMNANRGNLTNNASPAGYSNYQINKNAPNGNKLYYLNHKQNVHYNMIPVTSPSPSSSRSHSPRTRHLTSSTPSNQKADHTIITKLINLTTQQTNIFTTIKTLEEIIYKQRDDIELLHKDMLLKGNKATFMKHIKLKADEALVQQLFERNMKYSFELSQKYNITQDDIDKSVKNKVDVTIVEELTKDVDNIKSTIRSTVQEHLMQLTLGVRDRLRNIATKNELKLALKTKSDLTAFEILEEKMKNIEKYIYNDLDDGKMAFVSTGGGGGGMHDRSNNNTYDNNGTNGNDTGVPIVTKMPLQTRMYQNELALSTLRDQFQQLREMFDQGKESFDNAVEQLQKERNDNSEILQQHNVLKEENKNLRVLIDKLNERLDAQDNKINATNEHIERLEHEIDVKNNSSDEDIVFIKREINVMKLRLRDKIMALTNRIKKSVETWESLSLSKSINGSLRNGNNESIDNVIDNISFSASFNEKSLQDSSNGIHRKSRTAKRRHKRLTVSGHLQKSDNQ